MHTRIICSVVLTVLLTGSALWPRPHEDSGLRGPVIGYVLDATLQAVRPVNGIPGSSLLGRPLALPFPVAAAAFSPRGDFAIAVSASDDRTVHVLRNLGGDLVFDSIEGSIGGADRVFLNTGASAAVLLASGARQLQLVRGLPSSPIAEPMTDLSAIPGTITTIAVDRTGSNILIALSDGHGALYLAGAQASPRLVASFGSPTALALLNHDQDVVVADAAVNEIVLLRNFAGSPEAFVLARERDGVSGPSGLLISPESDRLYIANRASRALHVWNFAAQSIEASFRLDAAPTRLTPLQGSSVFVLNDAGEHPLLLLETSDGPAVYFVPADRDR